MERNVDLLIHHAQIVTMDAAFTQYRDATMAIRDGKIKDIGPTDQLEEYYRAPVRLDASGKLLMPGLVNAHTHAAMACLRGIADDLPLEEWLQHYIFPVEARALSPGFVSAGTFLALAEMLRAGTTLMNDMYYFLDEVIRCCESSGIRAVVSTALVDFPTPEFRNAAESMEWMDKKLLQYRDHPLVRVAVSPHAIYTCGEDTLKKAKSLADKHHAILHMHLAETRKEFDQCMETSGKSPVGYAAGLGLLDERTLAAHMVHLTEEDHDTVLRRKVGIAHLPESNLKLVSGLCPLERFILDGLFVGLGTDGVASNNNLDLFEEMQTASFMAKLRSGNPVSMPARSIVEMATLGGAKALGMDALTGSLEIGKSADCILINLNQPHLVPVYDIYSHIVYAMRGSDVDTVIIRGKMILQDKRILTFSEEEIMEKVRWIGKQLKPYSKNQHPRG